MSVGKIERLPLRDVWKHEEYDFTRWLEANVDVLNDIVDLGLTSARREKSAGSFSVDLVAEDAEGETVIIENQLEKSDHGHMGKLITYTTLMAAKAAVWIVADARPEHVSTITWLNNEVSPASFYLLKVEAVRIGSIGSGTTADTHRRAVRGGPQDRGEEEGNRRAALDSLSVLVAAPGTGKSDDQAVLHDLAG